MALKLNITENDYSSLSDAIKAEYRKTSDGYTLDVSGIEDTGALKRAKQHEAEARKEAEAEARSLRTRIASLESGTDDRVTTLQTELETTKKTLGTDLAKYKGIIESNLLDSAAKELAGKISTSPSLILPHIKSRLSVGFDKEGTPSVAVIGKDGKASALTLEDLGNEFVANTEFSAIIKGSGSSGGAGTRTAPAGGNKSTTIQSPTPAKNPAAMTPRELAAWTAERKQAREQATTE